MATLLLLSACNRQTASDEVIMPAPSGPQDPDLRVSPAGYHGRSFIGPVYIPRSSPIADGTTAYNVTYQKGVTVVSKDETMRQLITIHPDGSYLFSASALQILRLKPGDVLLLSGLALRTVLDVQKTAEGIALKTGPAKLTDAIKSGRIEGTYKIDFKRMQPRKSSSMHPSWPTVLSSIETVYAAGSETTAMPGVADFDVDFSNYNYHVTFTPGDDRINVKATIKFGGRQGVLAYEGVGYLSNFVSTIKMQVKDSQLTSLDFINSNLAGELNLKWYAVAADAMKAGSVARITSWPAELLKSAKLAKAAYHVPIVIGAMPFDLRISLGFSFIPAFTSRNSVVEGSKLIQYSGNGGFSLANGQTHPYGSFNVQADVTEQDGRVVASGPVGFTAAAEAPRLELAIGWPPAASSVAGYLNFVASYGIVTNGSASSAPCQTNILSFSVNAGDAYSSPNTFATWLEMPTGSSPSVSLWSKTTKSPGPGGRTCPA